MPFPQQLWVRTFDTVSLGWMRRRLLCAYIESRKETDLLKETEGVSFNNQPLWVLSGRGAQVCLRR